MKIKLKDLPDVEAELVRFLRWTRTTPKTKAERRNKEEIMITFIVWMLIFNLIGVGSYVIIFR